MVTVAYYISIDCRPMRAHHHHHHQQGTVAAMNGASGSGNDYLDVVGIDQVR